MEPLDFVNRWQCSVVLNLILGGRTKRVLGPLSLRYERDDLELVFTSDQLPAVTAFLARGREHGPVILELTMLGERAAQRELHWLPAPDTYTLVPHGPRATLRGKVWNAP